MGSWDKIVRQSITIIKIKNKKIKLIWLKYYYFNKYI